MLFLSGHLTIATWEVTNTSSMEFNYIDFFFSIEEHVESFMFTAALFKIDAV